MPFQEATSQHDIDPIGHDLTECLRLIRGEFHEMPGLQLTKPQIRRLWNLDADTCDAVVEELEHSHFLRRTSEGMYEKAGVERA